MKNTQRIGFCCIYKSPQTFPTKASGKEWHTHHNTRTTTIAWLNRQNRGVAENRLWEIAEHNVAATLRVLAEVAKMPPQLRMMRISSDYFPAYTHPDWKEFYQDSAFQTWCERTMSKIGDFARLHDIRLSFHPGQFVVLASENPQIVKNSIEEFEYHVDLARFMGYGGSWHDAGFKINVHASGKRGPAGILDALSTLTPEARNLITIENDEMTWGLDDVLTLAPKIAIVMDIHHHLLHSSGELIGPNDPRVLRVIDSWRGVRPTLHYSLSREDVLHGQPKDHMPVWNHIMASYKKTELRAHSNDCWNTALNQWALSFWDNFDLQIEAKDKNLAANTLYQQAVK
jgi:UV DNA damage repair endonuclease